MSAYSTISTYPSLLALWDRKARNQLLGSVPWSWTIACRRASFSLRLSSLGSELSSRRDNGDSVYDSSSCHLFFHRPLTGTFTCEHLYSSKIETDPLGNFQKSLNVRLMFTSSLSLPPCLPVSLPPSQSRNHEQQHSCFFPHLLKRRLNSLCPFLS